MLQKIEEGEEENTPCLNVLSHFCKLSTVLKDIYIYSGS